MKLKLSFIIPALNEERYIADCIDSIWAQSHKPFEIIVVDNNCTDKTAEIAKKLGCRVVKERKQGLSHARNKGAQIAKGNILCFIDADSIVTKNWVKEAQKSFQDGRVKVVDGLLLFSHTNPIKKVVYNIYILFVYVGIILARIFLNKHFLTGNNTAIKKDVFNKIGGFDPVVSEQIKISKKFWKIADPKGIVNFKMLVFASSRGFDKTGYIKTIALWAKAALGDVSQKGYSYKSKKRIF